jgi:hypothetical protein
MSTNCKNSIANEIQTPVENDSRQGRCELVLAKNITFWGGRIREGKERRIRIKERLAAGK